VSAFRSGKTDGKLRGKELSFSDQLVCQSAVFRRDSEKFSRRERILNNWGRISLPWIRLDRQALNSRRSSTVQAVHAGLG